MMIAGGLTLVGESRRAIKSYSRLPRPTTIIGKEVNFAYHNLSSVPIILFQFRSWRKMSRVSYTLMITL